ncbi:MerR family transcriptional regulator [Dactylosporangium sp. CS-047395]|uniref:MerR family transcriptional regulator n=1 Tax=Dactylosporangium sp. CS-047395 TaxID=3239936 RepID=UPI003D928539
MLSIGEFATLTHLSVRTLRRYHEAGLLEPAVVDEHTAYRRYSAEQIPAAQVIHQLRQLDVPLAEVRAILATADPDRRAALIAGHLERLQETLDRTRAAVASLRRLLRPEDPVVTVRSVPARTVAAITAVVALPDVLSWYATAMTELDASVDAGPPGGLYANELFSDGKGQMTVYRPTPVPIARGRVEPLELPAVDLAVAVHEGPHDDIDVTYGRLGAWVVDHALKVDGPIHETYLCGPRDTADPAAWRTEIGWPVFRLA